MLAEEIKRAIENRNRFRDPPFETGWWLRGLLMPMVISVPRRGTTEPNWHSTHFEKGQPIPQLVARFNQFERV